MTPSTQLENQGMEANEEYDSQTAQLLNYQVELKKEKQKNELQISKILKKSILQGPLTTLLMQQTWSSSQEE